MDHEPIDSKEIAKVIDGWLEHLPIPEQYLEKYFEEISWWVAFVVNCYRVEDAVDNTERARWEQRYTSLRDFAVERKQSATHATGLKPRAVLEPGAQAFSDIVRLTEAERGHFEDASKAADTLIQFLAELDRSGSFALLASGLATEEPFAGLAHEAGERRLKRVPPRGLDIFGTDTLKTPIDLLLLMLRPLKKHTERISKIKPIGKEAAQVTEGHKYDFVEQLSLIYQFFLWKSLRDESPEQEQDDLGVWRHKPWDRVSEETRQSLRNQYAEHLEETCHRRAFVKKVSEYAGINLTPYFINPTLDHAISRMEPKHFDCKHMLRLTPTLNYGPTPVFQRLCTPPTGARQKGKSERPQFLWTPRVELLLLTKRDNPWDWDVVGTNGELCFTSRPKGDAVIREYFDEHSLRVGDQFSKEQLASWVERRYPEYSMEELERWLARMVGPVDPFERSTTEYREPFAGLVELPGDRFEITQFDSADTNAGDGVAAEPDSSPRK